MSEDASAVSAGRLLVDVVADTSGLAADLRAKLEAISRDLKVQVKATVVAETAQAKTDIDAVARDRAAKIRADADTAKAKAELDALTKARIARFTAQADTAKAKADLAAVAAKERTAQITARAEVAKAKAELDAAAKAERVAQITARADAAKAQADLDAVARERKASIKALAENVAVAKAEIDAAAKDRTAKIKTAAQNAAAAKAEIDAVAADRTAKVKAGTLGVAEAKAEIDAITGDRVVKIKAIADRESLQSTIAGIGGTIGTISKGAGIGAGLLDAAGAAGNLVGGLVAVVGAASQAAGVIGALPGLLLGAAQGAGVLKLGFSGISAAVGAMSASQLNAGASAQTMAAAQQSAANSIRTSAQGLAAAQISAVQSVAAAQHNLQQSIIGVGDAQYNAAQTVRQAQHSVAQSVIATATARYNALNTVAAAEHSLAGAQFTEQQAQVSLTAARVAAQQNLVQMAYALRGAVIGEAQATITLREAQIHAANISQSVAATPQQRAQALLDVQAAQLALDESKTKIKDTAAAKALADKQGVGGSQGVVSAKHAESEATYQIGQTEAVLARSRVTAQQSVTDAIYQQMQAVQAEARARITTQRAIADAEYAQAQAGQSLTNARTSAATQLLNAQIAYRQALAAARNPLLGVSSQTTALAQALKALSPAGRAFAEFVFNTLVPRYKALKFAVQEAFLPPVQAGVTAALPLLGTLKTGLVGTAIVLGSFAQKLGAFLGSAASRADLSSVMHTNNVAFGYFGDALLHVLDALKNVAVAAEPLVLAIARGADHIAKLADASLKAGRASGGLTKFFHDAWVSAVLLGKIVWNVLDAVGHIFKAGTPAGTSLLGSLERATKTFSDWTGSASGQAKLKAFFDHTIPVVKQFADLIVHAAKVLGPFLAAMGGGQYNVLFSALNTLLSVLNGIVKIPGLGPIINWILALSLAGLGLGKVAASIKGISDGLKTLARLPSKIMAFFTGGEQETVATRMQAAGDTMLTASLNFLRAAGMMPAAAAEGGAGTAAAGAGLGSVVAGVLGGAAIAVAVTAIAGVIIGHFLPPATRQQLQNYNTKTPGPVRGFLNIVTAGNAPKISGALQGGPLGRMAGPDTEIPNWYRAIAGGSATRTTGQSVTAGGIVIPGSVNADAHQAGALPEAWSKAYEAFQRGFAGKITSWFTVSLPHVITGSIPKWFASVWGTFDRDVVHKVTDFASVTIPHTFAASIPRWFSGVWGSFDRDVVHKVTDFVSVTIPHTFADSIPRWFASVWASFTAHAVTPLRTWVTVTLPGYLTSTIPRWFNAAWGSFTAHVVTPLRTWVTVTLPGFFTTTIPRWFNAAWGSFTAHVVTPVRNWVTGTLPGYLTSTIPRWFTSVWGSFTAHVVNPISNFFKTTLPGVIDGAFKGAFNWIIGRINALTIKIPGVGKALQIHSLATGGVVPGGYSREDNQLAFLRSGEGVLQPGAVTALGGERFIRWANERFGDVPVGSGGPGHYAGGGIHIPNPVSAVIGAAKDVGGAIKSALTDAARLIPGALRTGFDHLWSAVVGPSVGTMAGWGPVGAMGVEGAGALKGAIDSFLGARDTTGTGNIGSGSGADVAKYAASYATGKSHPYVTGGQNPNGWDCSGFSAWVYEHFGYFPGAQKSRYGTSESQFADPRLQSSGPQTGALVFFNDGVYANPGHVGVLINPSSYVGADSPAVGTITSGIHGNVGFRVPKGGFQTAAAHGMVPANAGAIAAYLAAHGATRNAIAGILGNIWQESKGDPSIGLIQILGDAGGSLASELAKTLQYINANGSMADINAHSPTAQAAAVYFSDKYERPGIPAISNRIAAADASYAAGYDSGGPVPPGTNWILNGTGRDEWMLVPEAVDMLGGPAAVNRLNMAARVHRAAAAVRTAAVPAGPARGLGDVKINVYPQPGMTEEEVASIAARKLGVMLG